MHDCPAWYIANVAIRCAAKSRSVQSGQTSTAPFPPSSNATCLRGTRSRTAQPTGTEPVNDTTGSRGSSTSRDDVSLSTGRIDHDPAGRSVLGQDFAQQQRRQRRRRRGLQHDRRADRDRRGHLVRHQVQREVERRDAQHRPARHAPDQREPAGAARVGVEPLQLAREAAGLLGGPAERRHRASDLAARPLQRLAGLGRDQLPRSLRTAHPTPGTRGPTRRRGRARAASRTRRRRRARPAPRLRRPKPRARNASLRRSRRRGGGLRP